MNKFFLEYFRCPASYVDFRPAGDLLPTSGFFRFGPDLTCYGKVTSGLTHSEASGHLEDVSSLVRLDANATYLPFDPDQVAENLRLERYDVSSSVGFRNSVAQSVGRRTYYAMRPLLPTSVRKHLQRMALRGWTRTQFPGWPVDQTVDRLFEQMMSSAIRANSGEPIPFIWFWPEGYSSCAIVTHDVETCRGRDFCSSLMDLDDSFGVKASFQLIPEGRYRVSDRFLESFRARGFEINVHDFNHDGDLFRNREKFLQRVARINDYGRKFSAIGYRSGVLYRNLDWYEFFDYAYDMSVPNVGHLDPQPGGCCTTKPYFIGKILEIPVTATQDYTLFNILGQYSMNLWERQIESILEHHGLVSFIVHPDYLLDERPRGVYLSLLDRLTKLRRDSRMWIPLPRELNSWWRSRSEMRLTKHGSSWRAEGPDNHRARIAFATLDGDRLVYTFDGDLGRTQQRVTDSIAISSGSADLTSGSPSSLQAPSS
jgi:hypothetical protein